MRTRAVSPAERQSRDRVAAGIRHLQVLDAVGRPRGRGGRGKAGRPRTDRGLRLQSAGHHQFDRPAAAATDAESIRTVEGERDAAFELDAFRTHVAQRGEPAVRAEHPQGANDDAFVEMPFVLGQPNGDTAAGPLHQDARARQRERRALEVEVAGCPVGGAQVHVRCRTHRPPSPEAAMLFRMRRWPITNAISIGIVATADAAITSP